MLRPIWCECCQDYYIPNSLNENTSQNHINNQYQINTNLIGHENGNAFAENDSEPLMTKTNQPRLNTTIRSEINTIPLVISNDRNKQNKSFTDDTDSEQSTIQSNPHRPNTAIRFECKANTTTSQTCNARKEKEQNRPFKCSICNKSFKRKTNLKTHHRIHLKNKPFQCSICHKSFTQKHRYVQHSCSSII